MSIRLFLALLLLITILPLGVSGAMTCSITTAPLCTGTSVIVFRMSSSTNAHAELPGQSTASYANNVVCCGGVTNLSNICSGTFAVAAKLSSVTNAKVEQNTLSNYNQNACLSVSSGSITIGYQPVNCTGYDTTLASISSSTSAHVGSPADYATKICGSGGAVSQSLTFSISDNSIGFGTLSSTAARYATGDTLGSSTEVEAHQLSASSNATSGYTISVKGATLTSGAYTVNAIGGTNTASSIGSEQFGLRMSATGGSGVVTVPYAASGFAYGATASAQSQVASASSGDGVATVYSARYISNIAGNTDAAAYNASLIYTITANF